MLGAAVQHLRSRENVTSSDLPGNEGDQTESHTSQEQRTIPELQTKMTTVKDLYAKMHHELAMAKREFAWGKLRAKDINNMSELYRNILLPL